jgi:hypothetical protein
LAEDRIITLAGRELITQDDLAQTLAAHQPGDTVAVIVERDGEPVELALTFGERPDGGVSIGVSLRMEVPAAAEPTTGTLECREWIEDTYQVSSMLEELKLDLGTDYERILDCVQDDTQRMESANALKYCDNVFKVHCSALDLLTEIGEAQVQRCEVLLSESLGLTAKQHSNWRTCAQHDVFDRYSLKGEFSGEVECRSALLDECGVNIDVAIRQGALTADQRRFVDCCAADAVDACPMIDDGFGRGPCHDRSVCVDRLSGEWLRCSALP